ncbi:hypothetical protein SELMODRAFT_419085 [Selaginella moellendorffii]|uniref:Acyl-CoA dehydrogenase/oxidase C-terminal domain-containing protein n=1 Tax=Selaginella moellendorffii TaxID=88036 RepID=D8S7S8_SELML|nr:hypothetical protein SELMODRAFT_419085 [Selaginella moellendorffii]
MEILYKRGGARMWRGQEQVTRILTGLFRFKALINEEVLMIHSLLEFALQGCQSSTLCKLVFQDCFVPLKNILGQEGRGVYVMMFGLDLKRLLLAFGPLGLMQACMDVGKLADMYTKMQASRALVHSVARSCDAGHIFRKDCAAAISLENATQMALQASSFIILVCS